MLQNINVFCPDMLVLGRYEINRKRSEYGAKLVALKHRNEQAIDYFCQKLAGAVQAHEVVVAVPGHKAGDRRTGVIKLAGRVARQAGAIDGTACLQRTETVPRHGMGGPRCELLHLESIEVCHREIIAGKQVVLLDDVTTSGATIRACKFLLLSAGAARVRCIVLAKAVRIEMGY